MSFLLSHVSLQQNRFLYFLNGGFAQSEKYEFLRGMERGSQDKTVMRPGSPLPLRDGGQHHTFLNLQCARQETEYT
jgi:hypothetical protein